MGYCLFRGYSDAQGIWCLGDLVRSVYSTTTCSSAFRWTTFIELAIRSIYTIRPIVYKQIIIILLRL